MEVVVHLSPRRMCECGKTVFKLSEDERKAYDEATRRIREIQRSSNVLPPSVQTEYPLELTKICEAAHRRVACVAFARLARAISEQLVRRERPHAWRCVFEEAVASRDDWALALDHV